MALPPPAEIDRVIFSTEKDGGTLQVVQCRDGKWAISVNGDLMSGRRWEPREVESCIRTYLKMLQFAPDTESH